MPSATGSPHNRVRQSEIQEVTVEMSEESGKPSGKAVVNMLAHGRPTLVITCAEDPFFRVTTN